jgi:hypothetical protein
MSGSHPDIEMASPLPPASDAPLQTISEPHPDNDSAASPPTDVEMADNTTLDVAALTIPNTVLKNKEKYRTMFQQFPAS